MVFAQAVALALLLVTDCHVAATPVNNNTTTPNACASISALYNNNASYFPVDLARDCLRSVPLDRTGDALQLKGLRTLLDFQAEITYLQDPPQGYYYPAVDILGGLDELVARLNTSYYSTEYDLQSDVYSLVRAAHDTHLFYVPDLIGLFTFVRLGPDGNPYQIVSVSPDGVSLPHIYAVSDQAALIGNASHYTPSPITSIDGQDVETYLNGIATYEPLGLGFVFQDPDAAYNASFPNIPNLLAHDGTAEIGNLFPINYTYPDRNTTAITFANGTTEQTPIVATSSQNFSSITSGADLYALFCNATLDLAQLQARIAATSSSSSSSSTKPVTTRVPYAPIPLNETPPADKQLPTYPRPLAIASDNSIAGYFPSTPPANDLAVLTVPNFGPADVVEFENVVRQFLATAAANNKTRLLIDLRGNAGGIVAVCYDLFRQLFPSQTPYGTTNARAIPLLNDIGTSVSGYFDRNQSAAMGPEAMERGYYNPYNYHLELTANNTAFPSWDALFGPHVDGRYGNFTSLLRYNLSDEASTAFPAADVYGYGNNTAPQPQTFQPADIVLLQDGTCSSACALFTELVKSQENVRQVVVGGRRQTGPMQGVGGTKGAQQFSMYIVVTGWYAGYIDGTPSQQAYWNQTYGGLEDGWFVETTGKALARAANIPSGFNASLNLRNNIREADSSRTPLQFVYEAANCRFFYTPAMYASQEAVWNKAYELMWANGTCVEGSTGHPSSRPGTGRARSLMRVEETALWTDPGCWLWRF
ncbi:hypothetical protein M409DRAFT_23551 [Zasmidium cellare ATCC 36951]|uniref:Uncharacterized protein n=1 Tax=Zasmidium cellare ATCC 36951 TaxID=1080233 RepID=A0A6A6CJN7_ZASCE|nr:uncharacterized protein M409DRAFT_23551 [Zasmidium cellare ATCC 36951]KAF2166360.1 hypothetical protein M409DRAFT_23551 [Zasmidium cellare ATCC 36951]